LHPVSVPDGTTATLFYRMYLVDADSDSEYRIGVGEDFGEDPWGTTPWHQSWDSYETIVRNYVPLDGEDQTLAAITNPPAWASLDATIERQTWYSFWQVIDSVNNQFQVYIQGGDYATPTALTGPTGFRGGTESGDLTTFYVLTMGGGNEDFMYFDDLYLADGEDTSNPVGSAPLPGDLNGDGFVGGDDLDIVRGFWGQNVTPGDLLSGDPSGDGFVGGDDLDIVRGSWGQGTPPAAGAVPEPVALVFFATGMLALMACGRRRLDM